MGRDSRPDAHAFPKVPSWPLVLAIMAAKDPDESDYAFCKSIGLSDRPLREWRCRKLPMAKFDTADKICQRLELLWWEVWTEETCRRYAVTAVMYGRRRVKLTAVKGEPVYGYGRERISARVYGDLGPDHEALALVEYAFTGERLEIAA